MFKYIQLRLTVNAVPSHYGHVWNTDAILGHLIYSCQHFDAQISHLQPIDAVGVIYCLIVFPVHLLPWGFRLINLCRTIGIILCLALCASGKTYFALLITLFCLFSNVPTYFFYFFVHLSMIFKKYWLKSMIQISGFKHDDGKCFSFCFSILCWYLFIVNSTFKKF